MHDDDELVAAWRALNERSRRRGEAEDHLQDAVVAALDVRRRTGRTPDAAGAWLRTVARRREVDGIRRAQCERRVAVSTYAEETGGDVAADVLDRQEARWLAAHVDRLPPLTRDVVHALATGATQATVATRLDLTPRAVEAHVRRARRALRRVLERAGAIAAILRGSRRLRRTSPVVAAGVAAAVGVAMLGANDPANLLLPLPPVPHVLPSPGLTALISRTGGRGVYTAPAPPTATAATPRAAARRTTTRAGTPVPGPTAAPTPVLVGNDVVVVPAKGTDRATNFATEAGAWYVVTVAGTYSYNGRATGLADCGHYVPEGSKTWGRYEALWVDGAPAPCLTMPVDPVHTYQWRLRGTGRNVTFRVNDYGGGGDNLGDLVVSLRRADPPVP